MGVLGNGSKIHLTKKKKTFSILLRRPRAQARAPAKKDGKSKLAAEKIVKKRRKNCLFGSFIKGSAHLQAPPSWCKERNRTSGPTKDLITPHTQILKWCD